MERLGWREREFRGGLDTLPRPGEPTFEDEDFANCFIAGGTVAPSSAVATIAETAAPVAGTASGELDGEEVCVDGRDAETTAAGAGVVDDSRTSEGSAPPPHDPPAPRRATVYEPLDWRRPGVPPAPRPRVSARKLLRRPEPAVRRRRRLLTVAGAVAVAGIAGAFSGGGGPSRSTADAGQTQLTTQASSRAVPPPSDQLLHRTPSHAVGHVAARGAGHAARPHRRQRRRQPQRAKGATARRETAAGSSARARNPSSTGSSSGSYSGSGSLSYSGSSSAPSTSSQPVTSEPTPATSRQRIQPAQPTFGQNGSLGPGRGAPGTQ